MTSRTRRRLAIFSFMALSLGQGALAAAEATAVEHRVPQAPNSEEIFTSFDQIWQLSETEQRESHRVRLDCDVYYYDPQWKALWVKCADTDTYLSLGAKVFPIERGQRIRIEGKIRPVAGPVVEEASVRVLSESVPLEIPSATNDLGNISRFNKRLVTVEGLVDHQGFRDSNHLELRLIVEDRAVVVFLLLQSDVAVPQLVGSRVRVKGVYVTRSEIAGEPPKIEIWAQRNQDIEVFGNLDRDERFDREAIDLKRDKPISREALVRVVGTVTEQLIGKSVTIRSADKEVVLETAQTRAVLPGDEIEAVGYPVAENGTLKLKKSLYRAVRPTFTSVSQLWDLPPDEQKKFHQIRIEFTVYYYDPEWKALWGHAGNRDDYLSLGTRVFPIKTGQKILIQGMVCPTKGMVVENPQITVLADSVVLQPLETKGEIGNTDRFNKAWVNVEGYVDRQILTDKSHVELDLIVGGRAVTGRVLLNARAEVPKWEGMRLRLKGVYSATQDPSGGLPTIEIWTPGPDRIETLGTLDDDERFDRPLTAVEKLPDADPEQWVRIEGVARSQQPGKSIMIRDDTGQANVGTAQTQAVPLGERYEAIGYPVYESNEWRLRDGLFRRSRVTPAAPNPGSISKLRLADQLRELPPDEAAKGRPVQLSGVVTWARPNADFFFIRDSSGGVCVYRPPDFTGNLYLGTKVEVIGVSAPGKYTPVVMALSIQTSASVELPEPRQVSLEQALTGIEEAQWVSMTGYVRAVEESGPWAVLMLTTAGGEFQAMLAPNDRWAKLPGSVVRIRGVCGAIANHKRQLTGIQVWVPTSRFVEVEEAAPEDPFGVALRPIASLRQFSALEAMNRRVRVAGIVTYQSPGRLIDLQDGTERVLVLSRETTPLAVGDRIEVVGFPGRENSRLVLRDAIYRKISSGAQPPPQVLANSGTIDAEHDGLLTRLEGVLIDLGTQEKGTRLILQNNENVFEAVIDLPKAQLPAGWMPGSLLELTGVCDVQYDEYRHPHSVRLQLRSVDDVKVLRRPSVLTIRRVLAVAGILAVCAMLGFGWVLALRRRLYRQKDVIRDQAEKEKAARLEAALARASKLESVGVLAGGIAHDFNNLLTVILGNLSLARMDGRIDPETGASLAESERAALRAKDLTQQLLTFAKGGEPVRTATSLPDVVREATQFGLHGSSVSAEFSIAENLWPAHVDKGQIVQVVHNLILNARQAMADGGLVRIALENDDSDGNARAALPAGQYVKISISDTGAGISPEHVARIFEPYFTTKAHGSGLGLATVYSIVKKHQGHIEVQSTMGEGTTFKIWLPAAKGPVTAPVKSEAAPVARGKRVLLMDDEKAIRQLGSAVVKRLGFEVTTVNDGAAVVSEYAAARAAGNPYDLVILDLTVPGGMGGAEAMQKLREMDGDVKAIVSSGYSSDPVMANHRRYGFAGRVPKPYTAADLSAAVHAVLNSPPPRANQPATLAAKGTK